MIIYWLTQIIICKYFVQFLLLRGGVQGQNFWKGNFKLRVGGYGQDMYQQLKGGFGSINPMLPIWGIGAKNGPNLKKLR